MSSNDASETSRVPTDITFYDDRPPLKISARALLREYSQIPDDKIDEHVEQIRQRAFKIVPYPCIGMARFLELSVLTQNVYAEVLERVKKEDKFLDLGCCFGQEIRQLVLDGAPAENLVGSDLKPEFFEMGYELFGDKSTLSTKFIAADVFDPDSDLLQFKRQFNVIYTGSFFHLFTYDEQVKVAHLVNDLLVPQPGSMIVGRQVGKQNPGTDTIDIAGGQMVPYRHNPETWKAFWQDFGNQTNTRWSVDVEVDKTWHGFAGSDNQSAAPSKFSDWQKSEGTLRMAFVIRRL